MGLAETLRALRERSSCALGKQPIREQRKSIRARTIWRELRRMGVRLSDLARG